jgi:hypothetical protein
MTTLTLPGAALDADHIARIEAEEIARANIRRRLEQPPRMSAADSLLLYAIAAFIFTCLALGGMVLLAI